MNMNLVMDSVKAGYSLVFGPKFFLYAKAFIQFTAFIFLCYFIVNFFVSDSSMKGYLDEVMFGFVLIYGLMQLVRKFRLIIRENDTTVISYWDLSHSCISKDKAKMRKEMTFEYLVFMELMIFIMSFAGFLGSFEWGSDIVSLLLTASGAVLLFFVTLFSLLMIYDIGTDSSLSFRTLFRLGIANARNLLLIFAMTVLPFFLIVVIVLFGRHYFHLGAIFPFLILPLLFLMYVPHVGAMVHFHKEINK